MKKNYAVTPVLVAIVLVLIGAMALGFLSGVVGPARAQTTYVLDHFKGYESDNSQTIANPFVFLQDQFDRRLQKWELKKVGPADMFFNPVIKTVVTADGETHTTPIADPRDHLVGFPISEILSGMPQETTRWNVFVRNQFGKQKLLVGPATHILVPTEKLSDPNLPGFPDNLDHFKWYPVIKGKPVNIPVTLVDQWWPVGEPGQDAIVLKPVAFANPVRKIHLRPDTSAAGIVFDDVGIQHPEAHIVAYKLELPTSSTYNAIINNQFVNQNIVVVEGNLLLVPSAKLRYSPIRNPKLTN